jgi:hypothetical protein
LQVKALQDANRLMPTQPLVEAPNGSSDSGGAVVHCTGTQASGLPATVIQLGGWPSTVTVHRGGLPALAYPFAQTSVQPDASPHVLFAQEPGV